jgi:hypothetical protein
VPAPQQSFNRGKRVMPYTGNLNDLPSRPTYKVAERHDPGLGQLPDHANRQA